MRMDVLEDHWTQEDENEWAPSASSVWLQCRNTLAVPSPSVMNGHRRNALNRHLLPATGHP